MKLRPALHVGDIVKLSKKGRRYARSFPLNSTMVVSEVKGDGIDRASLVTCRLKVGDEFKHHAFYRSELWATGQNAFKK